MTAASDSFHIRVALRPKAFSMRIHSTNVLNIHVIETRDATQYRILVVYESKYFLRRLFIQIFIEFNWCEFNEPITLYLL